MANKKLRVGDPVIVIAGKDKGKHGEILAIRKNTKSPKKGISAERAYQKNERIVVQGINKMKRFSPPTQENPQGGEIFIERSIHVSNVLYYDSKASRGYRVAYDVQSVKENDKASGTDAKTKKQKVRMLKTKPKYQPILNKKVTT